MVVLGLVCYGLLGLIPFVGDILVLGLGLPVVIGGGAVMAVFLVGLVGYPLMYTTLSAEGDASDTFDALSRSINYVYQAPWQYAWYLFITVAYGAVVTFFVLFFSSLSVYMGKWAVSLTASAVYTEQKPDYLFIYAPESFGWKELLLKDSPYAVKEVTTTEEGAGRPVKKYEPVNPDANAKARSTYWQYHYWGAGLVCFWLTLFFLMMLGFSYSFFWSAATMIYFLMRKKADEIEMDEVFLEEDAPEAPPAPPKIAAGTAPPTLGTSLPVIQPPPAPPVVPPPPPPIPLASPPVVVAPPPVVPPPPPPVVYTPPPAPVVYTPPPEPELPPATLPFSASPPPDLPKDPPAGPKRDEDPKW